MIRAGTPTTVARGGTGFTTTLPDPTRAPSPMSMYQLRMPLAVAERRAAEDDTLVQEAVVAHLRRLADDDAHPVVDHDPAPDLGTRMDLDARHEAIQVAETARREGPLVRPERVSGAVEPQGVQARVEQGHLHGRSRRRIVLARRVHVLPRTPEGARRDTEPAEGVQGAEHPSAA
jgi:hypothetical protein